LQTDISTRRLGVFAKLAKLSGQAFGRTVLMKLCYFLQALKGVPLNYEFSLYSYGPFDSDVLADLQTAEELQILESTVHHYSGGYGYSISPGRNAQLAEQYAESFLEKYQEPIQWAASTFARRSAADLELISTLVFVTRENPSVSDTGLNSLVRAIKPHFSISEVKRQIDWLRSEGLLEAVDTESC